MERLAKYAIYTSMGIGLVFFSIFLIAVLPHVISDSGRQWQEAFRDAGVHLVDYETEKAKFTTHPAYLAFYEKYPEGGEYFRLRNNGGGEMHLTAMNFDTYTKLEVEMNLNNDHNDMYLQVRCENDSAEFHMRLSGTIVTKFIEESNCLESGHIGQVSPLIDEHGNPVPVPEPTHEEPYPLTCGDGAELQDGICVVE